MSRSIRKETSSLEFGMVGRFGGSSAGFVVATLNAASAASREVVVLRVLSAGILCPLARAFKRRPDEVRLGPDPTEFAQPSSVTKSRRMMSGMGDFLPYAY